MRKHVIKAFKTCASFKIALKYSMTNLKTIYAPFTSKSILVNMKLITTAFMEYLLGDRPCAKGLR